MSPGTSHCSTLGERCSDDVLSLILPPPESSQPRAMITSRTRQFQTPSPSISYGSTSGRSRVVLSSFLFLACRVWICFASEISLTELGLSECLLQPSGKRPGEMFTLHTRFICAWSGESRWDLGVLGSKMIMCLMSPVCGFDVVGISMLYLILAQR